MLFNFKSKNYKSLSTHLKQFFKGHDINEIKFKAKQISRNLPRFSVFEVGPGPKTELWTYISSGAWEVTAETGLIEFMIIAPHKDFLHIEGLAMTAFYHFTQRLGLGHTFPIGEAWIENSKCDHMLISHPYPYGPEFESWKTADQLHSHGHIFWLLPITKAERDYKIKFGTEALEEKFESLGLEYWNPNRDSVV